MMEPNFLWVTGGCILLSIASSRVGLYYFLQKRSLSGDVISHALLPGVVAGYLFAGEKNFIFLFIGAFVTGLISVLVMDWIQRSTFLKPDISMAIVLSSFYGIGVVLLTYTNRLPSGTQAGLDTFLFGKAASLTPADVQAYAILALVIVIAVQRFDRSLYIWSFDPEYAASIGLKVSLLRHVLTILIISAVVLGVQAVGVVLMSAFLILPPMAGRLISSEIRFVKLFSIAIAVIMAVSGSVISYHFSKMPTGPVMVVAGGLIVVSIFLIRYFNAFINASVKKRRMTLKIQREDLLKYIYKSTIEDNRVLNLLQLRQAGISNSSTSGHLASKLTNRNLNPLQKDGLLTIDREDNISLTKKGVAEAERIIRIHRLWEVYQATRLGKKPETLHSGAEIWEHYIPESIEEMLIKELNMPKKDPHNKDIPYDRP